MTLTLYGAGRSRSLRGLWALEEAGAEYAYQHVDFGAGEHRAPAYLALNPGGKIPTLVDGDFALTESLAIVTWIGDRFPAAALVPAAGTRERARYLQWCSFAVTELEQALWTRAKHKFALPRDWRVPQVRETAAREFERAEAVLAAGLGAGPWILGERFSMADVLLGHTLAWARSDDCAATRDNVIAYEERTAARPALARALARAAAQA